MKKKGWILLIFLLAGLVIGELIGQLAANVDYLWWLSYGEQFGIQEPVKLNLEVLMISFAFTIKINIASIVGVIISLFVYKKMIK